MEEKYVAAMILGGVGDAMGYKCGDWEFNFSGESIHKEVEALGGVNNLSIKKPAFIVSDDTVLLLSTADSLIAIAPKGLSGDEYFNGLCKELAFRYKKDFINDMTGRSSGLGTGMAVHMLKPDSPNGWIIPFNNRGGGCGAAMRAMCIGLRYPNVTDAKCLENLIRVSIESGRMTHNHPTGYLGSYATALFGAFSVMRVPLKRWGALLIASLPCVWRYIEQSGRDVDKNREAWGYFQGKWCQYLKLRNIENGLNEPSFPDNYDLVARDTFYKSVSFSGWGGASGHDAPLIAYDAMLAANDDWVKLCHHGMLHGGDNDSTGVIAGFCYGAMHGFKDVNKNNHKEVEKRDRLKKAGKDLYKLASPFLNEIPESITDSCTEIFESLFKE